MHPLNVPGLVRNNLIGMNGDDPTLPYVPSRRRRLLEPLRAVVRWRSAPPAPATDLTDSRGRTPAPVAVVALTVTDANGNTCLEVDARLGEYWPESGLDPKLVWCPASS